MITATIAGRSLTAFIDFVPYTIDVTHPNFDEVREILRSCRPDEIDKDDLLGLINIPKAIERKTYGLVTVEDGQVLYQGQPLHGYDVDRLLQMIEDGIDPTPLARFIERVRQNPRRSIVAELYQWAENAGLPLRADGWIIAYKKVRSDYTSIHDGRTMNRPGTRVSLPGYNAVDDNRHNTCSHGLHFCSWSYLPHFGRNGSDDRVVVLAIDPAAIVSIPVDYNYAKGRAWFYDVIGEIPQEQARHAFDDIAVVTGSGNLDDDYPVDDWVDAVNAGETTLGYKAWVTEQRGIDATPGEDDWADAVAAGETTLGYADWLAAQTQVN